VNYGVLKGCFWGQIWGFLRVFKNGIKGYVLEKIGKKWGYCKAELKGDKKPYFKVKATSYNYKKSKHETTWQWL